MRDAALRANYSRVPPVVLNACLPDRGVAQFTTRLAPRLKAISLTQSICLGQEVCGLSPFVESCGLAGSVRGANAKMQFFTASSESGCERSIAHSSISIWNM